MTATTLTLREGIARRVKEAQARGRLAETLHEVALDLVEPSAHDHLDRADWDRLCSVVHGPVELATQAALDTLLRALEDASDEIEPEMVARLALLRRRATVVPD